MLLQSQTRGWADRWYFVVRIVGKNEILMI